jgi:hypothetical protein
MQGVTVTQLIASHHFKNLTPEIDTDPIIIAAPDVNRPALPLTGFFAHFDNERLQVIGNVEAEYIGLMSEGEKERIFDQICRFRVPGFIFARNLRPDPVLLKKCKEYGVPVMVTPQPTADLTSELIRWLKAKLAPHISIHGVLVDVYGEGVLILGDSGVGKSEAALELIKRGHRLVADDVVELRKVSEVSLIGRAPDIIKHFIELRGIGIIDVKALFGAESVKDVQTIDLVIKLEEWDQNKDYDRLGMEDQYTEFLGVRLICSTLPIRPGRNLAIICETAAVNHRQKKMGYNAAKELYKRVSENMVKSAEQNELERHEEEIVAERRKIGEEMNLQVKEKIMGHLATIDVTDVPEHYGEFERNMCRAESDSADMDQLNTNQEQEQEAGHV